MNLIDINQYYIKFMSKLRLLIIYQDEEYVLYIGNIHTF